MRLLKLGRDGMPRLTEFFDDKIPQYAILSHSWRTDGDEVTFKDLLEGTGKSKAGYTKICFCGEQAARDHIQYFWVDTCCIDKSSSAELQEAINSMFRWYLNATRCYVYLQDVSTGDCNQNGPISQLPWESAFQGSRWFKRGWTLQELLAPASVEFFSQEGKRLGDKKSLEKQVHEISGIALEALQGNPLSNFSIAERFAWAEKRETTRKEDAAYSLLGIFDIRMSLMYGEGREEAFTRLKKKIGKTSKVQQPLPPNPSSTIPFRRDRDFVHRDIIDEIHTKCSEPASRLALVGLGGVGKSQLAIEYAYQLRDHLPGLWVFWVHAGSAARLEESYRRIAERAKMQGRDRPNSDIISVVYNWLCDEANGRWLMIVDNADDATIFSAQPSSKNIKDEDSTAERAKSFSRFLPQSMHGSILITSRSREVAFHITGDTRDIIPVSPMDEDHALKLLRKKLQTNFDDDNGKLLLQALDYMPLAISQAAAFISQRTPHATISKYLHDLKESNTERARLLNNNIIDTRRDGGSSNSILATWHISFENICKERPSAARLISLMSLFDRQGIPKSLLEHFYQDSDDSDNPDEAVEDFDEDVYTLCSYYLIGTNIDGTEFEMHRLVQFSTKIWLEIRGELEKWKEKFIKVMKKEFPAGTYENWTRCRELFPHAEMALECQPANEKFQTQWASLMLEAGSYADAVGNYKTAEKMKIQAVNIYGALGSDDTMALSSKNNLAVTFQNQCRWKEAEELLVQVVESNSRVLGVEHPDTLTNIANLARTYSGQGQWKEAEKLEVQVMETSKRVLGVEHLDTLLSIANLARTYSDQGQWKEAEKLEVQVMEARKRLLGAEHPDTLTSIANLALTYSDQGQWKEAEKLEVQVIEARKRLLGAEHPNTLLSIANLARTYSDQGQWKEAEKLEVQVMEARKRLLGVEHPNTLLSIANLAATYSGQGQWKEAEELEVQVIEARKRLLGAEHPNTLLSIANLAATYSDQGQWKEAEKLEVQVMEARKRLLGAEHPDTLTSIANLAATYSDQGQWKEAEELEVQVIEARKRLLGAEHPDTLISMNNLAHIWKRNGQDAEGTKLMEECVQLRTLVLGANHPRTLHSSAALAGWQTASL